MPEEFLTHDAAPAPAPAAEAPATSTETQQTVEPAFNPQEWALNYKGQPIIPKDRQHLINLAQKGHSFEQSMEGVNKLKKEIEEQRLKFEPYQKMDQLFQENPAYRDAILAVRDKFANGTPVADGTVPQTAFNPQYENELSQLKNTVNQLISGQEDYKVNQEIDALKKRYPDHQWDVDDGNGRLDQRLIKHMMDNKIGSLNSAYRDYFFDEVAAKAQNQAIAQGAQKQKELNRAGVVQQGTPAAQPVQKPDLKKASYDDITKIALERLGG